MSKIYTYLCFIVLHKWGDANKDGLLLIFYIVRMAAEYYKDAGEPYFSDRQHHRWGHCMLDNGNSCAMLVGKQDLLFKYVHKYII